MPRKSSKRGKKRAEATQLAMLSENEDKSNSNDQTRLKHIESEVASIQSSLSQLLSSIKLQTEQLKELEAKEDSLYWEETSLPNKVTGFMHEWTAHGIVKTMAPRRQPLARRVLWCALFVAALGMLLAQVGPLLAAYADNETLTSSSKFFSSGERFPAVTVCPRNPLKCTCAAWAQSDALSYLTCDDFPEPQEAYTAKRRRRKRQENAGNGTDVDGNEEAEVVEETLSTPYTAGWSKDEFDLMRANTQCGLMIDGQQISEAQILAQVAAGQVDGKDLLRYGAYALDELVDSCFWHPTGEYCDSEAYWTPAFVNDRLCYTFNLANGLTSQRAGTEGGLQLRLSNRVPTYQTWQEDVGIELMIHDQQSSAAAHPERVVVQPMQSYRVGVEKEVVTLLGGKYKPACKDTSGLTAPYSIDQCFERCWAKPALEVCNCRLPGLGLQAPAAGGKGERFCSDVDNVWCSFADFCYESDAGAPPLCIANPDDQRCCGYRVQRYIEENAYSCDGDATRNECLQPCNLTRFNANVQAYAFPNIVFAAANRDDDYWLDVTDVSIYFASLNLAVSSQIPKVRFPDLLGAIGGNLGLWTGISVLSVLALIEAIVMIIVNTFIQKKNKK